MSTKFHESSQYLESAALTFTLAPLRVAAVEAAAVAIGGRRPGGVPGVEASLGLGAAGGEHEVSKGHLWCMQMKMMMPPYMN